MDFTFNEVIIKDITSLIEEYTTTLTSPFDSFYEDLIDESKFYSIDIDNSKVGYFAVLNDKTLTQFYLKKSYLKHSQDIYNEVLEQFQIKDAFVPTCDELFISLTLDKDVKIEKQAYFFQDSMIEVSDKSENRIFRTANKVDISKIKNISDDFFDKLEDRINNKEIFVYLEDDELLGAGIIEKGRVLKNYTSIGMFTSEKHRRKGIGRSIIINLKKWCYDNNQVPICGCWYYNHNSKKTLESAGMITKTRLLFIKFI